MKDLLEAADFYERGARNSYGQDAYPHINAAFVNDLLADIGDRPEERKLYAKQERERILDGLTADGTWFNAATRAEAHFGLGDYNKATEEIKRVGAAGKPEPWNCPNCGQPMKLARVTPRVGGLPELHTFECRPCGVVLTDTAEDLSGRPNVQ